MLCRTVCGVQRGAHSELRIHSSRGKVTVADTVGYGAFASQPCLSVRLLPSQPCRSHSVIDMSALQIDRVMFAVECWAVCACACGLAMSPILNMEAKIPTSGSQVLASLRLPFLNLLHILALSLSIFYHQPNLPADPLLTTKQDDRGF